MIVLGLPRPTTKFPTDRGPVDPHPAGDLCLAGALLVKFLNLDPVINHQMSVMCVQGSASSLGVISITTTYEVLHFHLELGPRQN